MTRGFSRRQLLQSLSAGISLIASPGLGRTAWDIRGSGRGRLRLVFHTDIHADSRPETSEELALAAEEINAQKPDLVLCGGDLIAGGFTATPGQVAPHWEAYRNMARAIKADQHAVIGNHDLVAARPIKGPAAADPRSEFKQHLGVDQTYGTFDALGYRFILLDSLRISSQEHMYDGWVSHEQLDWLEELIASTRTDMPVVLLLHMPLLTSFWNATEGATHQAAANRVVVNNTEVLTLFGNHNLVLVLQGHLHVSEAIQWRGTTFLTGGAICGGWWRGPYFGTQAGFNVITLDGDRIEWEYIGYGRSRE